MNQSDIRGRLIVIGVVVAVSIYFLIGTFQFASFSIGNPFPEKAEARVKWEERRNDLLKNSIRPGLDLMGGVDVLLSIDEAKIALDELTDQRLRLRRALSDTQILARIRVNQDKLALEVSGVDEQRRREALDILTRAGMRESFEEIDADAFMAEGKATLVLSQGRSDQVSTEVVERTRDLIRERVDGLGLVQPSVATQGNNRIRIQLPGETDPAGTVAQVVRPAYLQFRLVHPRYETMIRQNEDGDTVVTEEAKQEIARDADSDWVILPGRLGHENKAGEIEYSNHEFVLQAEEPLTGRDVASAVPFAPAGVGAWEISVTFAKRGVQKMADLSRANVGRRMAIVLDGVVRSAPNIIQPIVNGQCTIQGGFTLSEANQLARVISTGALPVKLRTESSRVIGAKLGSDSIRSAVEALGYGGALVILFMIAYYAGSGLVAVIALLINILVILALLASWGATLTLSGIAGILLTIGMAVDANVLIYERIREELRAGKRAADAIAVGFDNAFSTIVDANMTTLITALILLQFGKGSVQGFALTMTFGIFATLFTGLYVTRTLFGATFEKKNKASLGGLTIFRDPSINFLGMRWGGYALSLLVIALGFFSIEQHGGLILGTDFKGGVIAEVSFPKSEGTSSIHDALAKADERLKTVDVVSVHNADSFLLKTKLLGKGSAAVDDTTAMLTDALEKAYPGKYEISGVDTIGNEVSGDFAHRAITAFIIASLGILVYIWLRFRLWFGYAAVIALVHDVLVTLGVITFLNIEVTLEVVAALMVVIGYSINDTIVIFDRVRELLNTHLKEPFGNVVNMAINQSLNRTLVTSLTTLAAIVMMYAFAGQGLRDFSITLLIGTITGTYSSSFVASPLLAFFAARREASEG